MKSNKRISSTKIELEHFEAAEANSRSVTMAQKVEMTISLLLICILAFLTCSQASRFRGPFGFRNPPSFEVSSSSFGQGSKSPKLSFQTTLQIRGGDPSTKTIPTDDENDDNVGEKKPDVSAKAESAVEMAAQNSTTVKTETETADIQKEIDEIEESDLDSDDEHVESIEIDVDDEEDFYTDSEDSDSDYEVEEEEDEVDDEEKEHLEIAIETAVEVSRRAGVLALKFSKVAAFWVRQWSWDIYRACERAVGACREELVESGEDVVLTKAEMKGATRLQLFRKKSWRITKRTCKMIAKMTVAFWTMDDNDILVSDKEETETIKPKFSFLEKLKLSNDAEEEDEEVEVEEKEKSCKPESSSHGRRKKRKSKRVKKKKASASLTSTKAPKDEEKTVVTVVPRVRTSRRVVIGLAVGVVCGFFWEQMEVTALIAKGISSLPPKLKPWRREASLANGKESES